MPGLTIPSEGAASSSASSPSTPAQPRRASTSTSTPQQPQPQPRVASSPSSESPNASSPNTSSPLPAHLTPTITGSGTYYYPNFAADRPRYKHSEGQESQEAANTVAPGAPTPVDFDSNPDVLALQSTMSILLLQRQRAAADMVKLKKVKEAALTDPEGFVRDLESGKVGSGAPSGTARPQGNGHDEADDATKGDGAGAKPWHTLPTPQNVVRMPPINWDQYAVVGSSLDKLHEEQRRRPSAGAPTTYTPGGTYVPGKPGAVQSGSSPGGAQAYAGPLAPYNPLADKVEDSKPKRVPVTPKR